MTDDTARANAYALLAACQTAAPSAELLAQLAKLPAPPEDDTGKALARLVAAAATVVAVVDNSAQEAVADDYHNLFIGLGRGKVAPYASYYLTGNMMDKPLAALRTDLAALGIARQKNAAEPEDHAGALCELMAMLCAEESAEAFARQKKLFDAHLAAWMEALFADITREAETEFYQSLGNFGTAFIRFEKRYFGMMF